MQNDQTISNKYSDDNSISVASEMNTINYIFAGSSQGFNGTRQRMWRRRHYISILQVGKLFMNNTRAVGVGSDGVGPNAFQSDNLAKEVSGSQAPAPRQQTRQPWHSHEKNICSVADRDSASEAELWVFAPIISQFYLPDRSVLKITECVNQLPSSHRGECRNCIPSLSSERQSWAQLCVRCKVLLLRHCYAVTGYWEGNDTGCSQVIPNYLSIKLPRVILNLELCLCLSLGTIGLIVTFVSETYLLIFNCHLSE